MNFTHIADKRVEQPLEKRRMVDIKSIDVYAVDQSIQPAKNVAKKTILIYSSTLKILLDQI
jgi:hypothetical protein